MNNNLDKRRIDIYMHEIKNDLKEIKFIIKRYKKHKRFFYNNDMVTLMEYYFIINKLIELIKENNIEDKKINKFIIKNNYLYQKYIKKLTKLNIFIKYKKEFEDFKNNEFDNYVKKLFDCFDTMIHNNELYEQNKLILPEDTDLNIEESIEEIKKQDSNDEIPTLDNNQVKFPNIKDFEKLSEDEKLKEIQKMIQSLNTMQNNNPIVNKMSIKTMNKINILSSLFEIVCTIILNIIGFLALSGFIKWGQWQDIGKLVLFILYYSLIESFCKAIINIAFRKLVIKTLGIILVVPILLSMIITIFIPIFVELKSIILFIIVCIIVEIIRKFIIKYIADKIMQSEMKRSKGRINNGR